MPTDALPLRRPPAWQTSRRFGLGTAVFGGILVLGGIGIGILTLLQDQTAHAPLFALAGGGGLLAWGVVLLGIAFPPHPQPPTLVNAVAVTPGDEAPPDSWVHLFRRRRMAPAFAIGVAALSAYLLVIAGGTVWLVIDGSEDAWLLFFVALPLFSAIFVGVYAWREALSRRRLSTFGRPPTGLTLGASGLTLLDPHRTRFIPWTSLVRVSARNAVTRGGSSPYYPVLDLMLPGENVEVQLAAYVASPHVVYSAVVTAVEDADFRGSLGTTHAQTVLERWAALAPGRKVASDSPG